MYLGPAAWRPFNKKLLDGFNFEKGGGFVGAFNGGGVLEWGSHCVDLCQWAVGDCPPPVEYNAPKDGQLVARYENGTELIFRRKAGFRLGSCPVRFEGEDGLGRSGGQRQTRVEFARVARRQNGRRNRRLSGDVPRPRLPRLCEDAQPAERAMPTRLATPTSPATRQISRSSLGPPGEVRLRQTRVHQRRTGQSFAIRGAARTVGDCKQMSMTRQ